MIGEISTSDHQYCPGYGHVHRAAAFTSFINNGGLTIPSQSVYKVVACAEKVFKATVCKGNYREITAKKHIKKEMNLELMNYFWGETRPSQALFESHSQGINEVIFKEDHDRWLTKFVEKNTSSEAIHIHKGIWGEDNTTRKREPKTSAAFTRGRPNIWSVKYLVT